MLSIHQLIRRMKKANNVKCGIEFTSGENVTLWWEVSLFQRYELSFTEFQLSVDCHQFQRAMKKAELDMGDML